MDVGFVPSVVYNHPETNLTEILLRISVSAVEQNKQEAENISGNSSKPSELECAAHLVSAKKKIQQKSNLHNSLEEQARICRSNRSVNNL